MSLAVINLWTVPPYNSGNTGIPAGTNISSKWVDISDYVKVIAVIAGTDAPGTLYLEQSNDQATVINANSIAYTSLEQITANAVAKYARVRAVTGSSVTNAGVLSLDGVAASFQNMGNADATSLTGEIIDKGGQVYNIKTYGAKVDGVTDDTTAWQDALAAAGSAGHGIVYHPGGVSVISNTLVIPTGVWIVGVGSNLGLTPGDSVVNGSIIHVSGSGYNDIITTPSTSPSKGSGISKIAIDGAASATGYAIHVYDVNGFVVDNFAYRSGVANGPGGIFLDGVTAGGYNCSLQNVSLEVGSGYLGGVGLKIGGAAPFNANHFSNLNIQGFTTGIDFNYGGGNTVISPWVQGCTNGILFGSSRCVTYGGWMENITTNWINFASAGGEYSLVDGMRFASAPTVVGRYGKISNSTNYNPTGPQTAPAIPASGTALTNPFPFDAMVYISGGTVTAIAVGGTATGLTSGGVLVPAGETITLTYSAAPTWVWIGN